MKQEGSTTNGIDPIEIELMLSPLKGQLDDITKKLDALINVTLAWNESIDNINRHLSDSMDALKDHMGLIEDSETLINIEEFILKSSYERDEADENVIRLNPNLFNGGEDSDNGT